MKAPRKLLWPCSAFVLLALLSLAGCGSVGGTETSADYPIVEPTSAQRQPAVTTPDGAVVALPALPTARATEPGPTCERERSASRAGDFLVIPPPPGLRAVAVTKHTTRVEWSLSDLPADCRPAEILVSVRNGTDPRALPTNKQVAVSGLSGSTDITYPDFLPVPTVALASVYSGQGTRSRTASVLIERPANVPDDPSEPVPPATALAGQPTTCVGPATAVDDPVGDVLTYKPGSSPAQVSKLTRELSAIDITHASVQIDGRKVCATFELARAPADLDFQLTFSLRDTSTSLCCASLRFKRSAGRLELGNSVFNRDGEIELQPVSGAGAALHGTALRISGTLPPPDSWQYVSHRMPSQDHIGWSVSTAYAPDKYGPYFGDWLPGYEETAKPMIRQRDGKAARPGVPQ